MPRDYKLYLEDILGAIEKIEEYSKDVSFVELNENQLLLDAILYNLQIIGEAAKHISDDIKKKHPDVEWRKIAGLRDIVAHEYIGISLEIVWDILQNKLPSLHSAINLVMEESQ
jgi:uncharacterized protein with HEPN domain